MKEEFEKELEAAKAAEILSPKYRRKKLIMWAVRTTIAIVLYIIFWKYQWVRWSLWVYVPLNLMVPIMLLSGNYFLNKKVESIKNRIGALEDIEE